MAEETSELPSVLKDMLCSAILSSSQNHFPLNNWKTHPFSPKTSPSKDVSKLKYERLQVNNILTNIHYLTHSDFSLHSVLLSAFYWNFGDGLARRSFLWHQDIHLSFATKVLMQEFYLKRKEVIQCMLVWHLWY